MIGNSNQYVTALSAWGISEALEVSAWSAFTSSTAVYSAVNKAGGILCFRKV